MQLVQAGCAYCALLVLLLHTAVSWVRARPGVCTHYLSVSYMVCSYNICLSSVHLYQQQPTLTICAIATMVTEYHQQCNHMTYALTLLCLEGAEGKGGFHNGLDLVMSSGTERQWEYQNTHVILNWCITASWCSGRTRGGTRFLEAVPQKAPGSTVSAKNAIKAHSNCKKYRSLTGEIIT